jgi:hypothetical protein
VHYSINPSYLDSFEYQIKGFVYFVLESLVNLEWLDLSFNKIQKIQNLGSQTQLKVLALFNNKIAEIENLEHLQELGMVWYGTISYGMVWNGMVW